jgi:uncharacterized membrane protein (DUF4010 family)
VLAAALGAGLAVAAFFMRRSAPREQPPIPQSGNPAEVGTALRFGALYAVVLLLSAWLSDLAGERGLYAAALSSGLVDIDAITLSTLNFWGEGRLPAQSAVAAIGLAYVANVVFKLSVLLWFNRRLALRAFWPLAATIGAGAAVHFLLR